MQNNEALLPKIDDLVHAYYPAVVRLALSILDDGSTADLLDEAEDAAQETFISAAGALSEYRGTASPKTWLFAIAINACRSRLRRRKARRALTQAVSGFQRVLGGFDQAQSPDRAAERAERDRQLWRAVDRLDEKHRLVILLRYVQELSAAEIAQVLEITEGTVHSRLHYARQQLAGSLRRSAVFEEAETI